MIIVYIRLIDPYSAISDDDLYTLTYIQYLLSIMLCITLHTMMHTCPLKGTRTRFRWTTRASNVTLFYIMVVLKLVIGR